MKLRVHVLVLAMVFAAHLSLHAQMPRTLSYQGVLTDTLGNPKPDASYILTFRMYDASTGGNLLYVSQQEVSVKRGLFAVILGNQPAFGVGLSFDRPYWLGIDVLGSELSPRIALTSVAYSLNAARADTAAFALAAPADPVWTTNGENISRVGGYVGVGTATPGTALDVVGQIRSTQGLLVPNDLPGAGVVIGRPGFTRSSLLSSSWQGDVGDYVDLTPTGNDGPGGLVRVTSRGAVGIGTTAPGASLEVAGATKLGSDAPAVKMIKLSGIYVYQPIFPYPNIEISSPVAIEKMISVSMLIDGTPAALGMNGREYNFICFSSPDRIEITSRASDLDGKSIIITVLYEE